MDKAPSTELMILKELSVPLLPTALPPGQPEQLAQADFSEQSHSFCHLSSSSDFGYSTPCSCPLQGLGTMLLWT
jgi:hypothetical protein